jgi:hypothetical protein
MFTGDVMTWLKGNVCGGASWKSFQVMPRGCDVTLK